MNNLFPPHRDIHARYDLKGSIVGRTTSEHELEVKGRSEATRKDGNWLNEQMRLLLGNTNIIAFHSQLERDVDLLKSLGLMDYSLLVGLHDTTKGNAGNLRAKNLKVFRPEQTIIDDSLSSDCTVFHRTPSKLESEKRAQDLREKVNSRKPVPLDLRLLSEMSADTYSKPGFYFYQDDGGLRGATGDESPIDLNEIYYLGIIDCLTKWSFKKKAENFWKGLSDDRAKISPVKPLDYAERFVKFIKKQTWS